ncbi:GNAT family N-acetyltransferase [Aeromonas bivalvium]|uniref:GNAT family N-acetyltransferase n=1 Tax=Aeromonas bivalvium TaxID=440079 RepID=UPI0038D07817
MNLEYGNIAAAEIPLPLLLEADPSEQRIAAYLPDAWCFAARAEGILVGICVAGVLGPGTAEIFNVAVRPDHQRRGIGSGLLRHGLAELAARGIRRVELGTGSFGHPLTCYQRLGFRVDAVVKDHFLRHYPEPIFESGIQHKDMLRLSLTLEPGAFCEAEVSDH